MVPTTPASEPVAGPIDKHELMDEINMWLQGELELFTDRELRFDNLIGEGCQYLTLKDYLRAQKLA